MFRFRKKNMLKLTRYNRDLVQDNKEGEQYHATWVSKRVGSHYLDLTHIVDYGVCGTNPEVTKIHIKRPGADKIDTMLVKETPEEIDLALDKLVEKSKNKKDPVSVDQDTSCGINFSNYLRGRVQGRLDFRNEVLRHYKDSNSGIVADLINNLNNLVIQAMNISRDHEEELFKSTSKHGK